MASRKLWLFVVAGVCATALVTAIATRVNERTVDFANAATIQKEFLFDKDVASQVQYGGNETGVVSNVTTGISTPIATKLYRESGDRSESAGKNNCFFSADYSNQRAFAFEAGLNNLVGFEIQFRYSYNENYDNGLFSHFNYDVTMNFYHGKTVVDTAEYSLAETVRGTVYTHSWTKEIEVTEKIDRVKCTLSNGGGGSKTDWRQLFIEH